MKLAMSNIAWSPRERIAAYRILANAGFSGLEIAPGLFFHAAEAPLVPADSVARKALNEITGFGLNLVSMQSLLFGVPDAGLFDGADARVAFEKGMNRAIELAGRFGIPNLVFGSPRQRRVPAGMAMDQALTEAAEVFRRLGDAALRAGTTITIEANPGAYGTNFLNTLEQALDFVGQVDHPAIAAILDLGAMRMNGVFDTVPEQAPGLMPRLNHVHVSEPHLAPAPAPEHAAAITPVLQALRAEGYDKAVSIEMKPARANSLAEVEGAVGRLAKAFADMEAQHA